MASQKQNSGHAGTPTPLHSCFLFSDPLSLCSFLFSISSFFFFFFFLSLFLFFLLSYLLVRLYIANDQRCKYMRDDNKFSFFLSSYFFLSSFFLSFFLFFFQEKINENWY